MISWPARMSSRATNSAVMGVEVVLVGVEVVLVGVEAVLEVVSASVVAVVVVPGR